MKNSADVSRHQVNKGLDSLARQIVEEEFSREMIKKEIEEQFNYISLSERRSLVSEVINRSYRYAWTMPGAVVTPVRKAVAEAVMPGDDFRPHGETIRSCFAFRIVRYLVGVMKKSTPVLDADGSLGDEFYARCLRSVSRTALGREIGDPELLEIYLRQAALILKKTGIARQEGGRLIVDESGLPVHELYSELLLSFWERVEWDELFPSNPAASRDLGKVKNMLVDLVLREKRKFRVDGISNEFFGLTGFSEPNDLYMISFLDFYFFTWMSHFGILRYCTGKGPVSMEITPFGRTLLSRLQSRA
jgi:hypothetical protein